MMTLRYYQPLHIGLFVVVAIVSSALCDSDFLSKRQDNSDLSSQYASSVMRPLQVVDCVLEKCMWLTNAKDKRLCTYLLCLGGSRALVDTLHGDDVVPRDRTYPSLPLMTSAYKPDDYSLQSDDYPRQDMMSSRDMARSKKWQYPDPLRYCVQSKCTGQSGVDFYTCVYKNCIAGKVAMQFMAQ